MCGFLVEYTAQKNLMAKGDFISILNTSIARGPDDQGYWLHPEKVQMGFNRLAILDVSSAGKQPMHSHTGRYTVVFNGEIYNHQQLRENNSFTNYKGQSDTETLVACLDSWGIEKTIMHLNGMFSMVVFDHQESSIHLIRDFAGIKPLFYGWDGHTLVAASQWNQVLLHPSFKNKSLQPQVLNLYLQQQFIPAPFGLYQDTFQVQPGELVSISKNNTITKKRYWEFPAQVTPTIFNFKEAVNQVGGTLDKVVKRQLLSDVPLGAFLSGGVDSTLIGSSIKKTRPDLETFTIGSDSTKHDESERAKQFAEALEFKQHIWNLDASKVIGYWEEAIGALHEPLADFSIIPTYLVSKLAKKHVTVALSGDGGDELFFGYERFWSVGKNITFQNYPALVRKGIYGFDKYYSGNKNLNSVLLSKYQSKAHQGLHTRFKEKIRTHIAPHLSNVGLPEGYDNYNYKNTKDIRTLLAHMRKAEFYGMMQKTLRKVDLASMENSLEVRVPFLDKQMIEMALSLDPLLSYGGGKQKKVLKNLLHQRIPQVAEEETKKGFSIPLTSWMRGALKPMFYDTLLQQKTQDYGFDKKAIEKMLDSHSLGKEDLKWPIFTLYALLK